MIIRSRGAALVGYCDKEIIGLNGFAALLVIDSAIDIIPPYTTPHTGPETFVAKLRRKDGKIIGVNTIRDRHYYNGVLGMVTGACEPLVGA